MFQFTNKKLQSSWFSFVPQCKDDTTSDKYDTISIIIII